MIILLINFLNMSKTLFAYISVWDFHVIISFIDPNTGHPLLH